MPKNQTPKEEYDELIADLKAGEHSSPDKQRAVLSWDEYDLPAGLLRYEPTPGHDAVPHPYAGKHIVTVQYAGPEGGDGGLLRDFAFDPAALKEPEPESEPAAFVTVADKPSDKSADKPVVKK
jgi:hypothetical protein